MIVAARLSGSAPCDPPLLQICVDLPEREAVEFFFEILRRFVGYRIPRLTSVRVEFTPRDEHDWARASGDVTCEECGGYYSDHPEFAEYRIDCPTMRVLCDGRRDKL